MVVIPVLNEKAAIDGVLDSVRERFGGPIVVVDDGSADGTQESLRCRHDVSVVCHDRNRGYGASLLDGFAAAYRLGAGRILTMDGDGQHDAVDIEALLDALADSDIVSGSRYLPGSRAVGEPPVERADINRRITAEINRVTGWRLTDAFCGMKAYRASSLARLRLSEPGYAMPLELWAQAWRAGLRVLELPVARIYTSSARMFGGELDDAGVRQKYYTRVWRDALERDHDLPGEPTP